MLVALGVEIAKGNTGFYSDWVVLPHFSLVSTISRNREPFAFLKGPMGQGGGETLMAGRREFPDWKSIHLSAPLPFLRVCHGLCGGYSFCY